jgi:hypothetical protein
MNSGRRAGLSEAALRRYREVGGRSNLPFRVRLERYCLIRSMRDGAAPFDRPLSLQQIADRLVGLGYERMSRERVRQLLVAPPVERRAAP